jgi:osmotically-inducible protein OsmY
MTRDLERVIYERIASRLGKRVRNLVVAVDRGVIHLAGQCSTYYTKQLAQHVALGVLEDEVIDNAIEVAVPGPVAFRGPSGAIEA